MSSADCRSVLADAGRGNCMLKGGLVSDSLGTELLSVAEGGTMDVEDDVVE